MKEIPIPLVRANQWVMFVGTLCAIFFQSSILLTILFVITLSSVLFGSKGNLVFQVVTPFIKDKLQQSETEAAELQRFNQTIATILLGLATLTIWLSGHWLAWVFAGMVTVASGVALAGFCVGCFIYFQWKQRQGKRS